MVRCVLTLSILPFSTAKPSNTRPKYLRHNIRFITEFGTKTPSTIWCVEIKLETQAHSLILLLTKREFLSTQLDIVEHAAKLGFSKILSIRLVETLLETIKSTPENNEDVLISGLGKLCVRDKRKKRGRNPQTGDDMALRERRVVIFKCSGVLRESMNGKGD